MTLPNSMTKEHMDLGTDDPRQARDEFADNVDLFNALLVHLALSSLTSTPATVGEGLEVVAGALRAQLNGVTLLRSGSGLSVNIGAGANQIVQLDGSGRLPTLVGPVTFTQTSTGVGLTIDSTAPESSTEGPRIDLKRSAVGASGNLLGVWSFPGQSDAGVERTFAKISASIVDATDASEDGQIIFNTIGGGVNQSRMTLRLGLEMRDASGNRPTGEDKGVGTINAFAVYDENVVLTDYVFDQAYDGQIAFSKYEHVPAWQFQPAMLDIEWLDTYCRKHRHFPNLPGQETWTEETRPSVGSLAQALLEIVEVQAVQIASLNDRIKALEAK